nr:hypothetical protein [Escherichia coli]
MKNNQNNKIYVLLLEIHKIYYFESFSKTIRNRYNIIPFVIATKAEPHVTLYIYQTTPDITFNRY